MIVREALHNVPRHATATRLDISLEVEVAQLTLLITDDSCGFDTLTPRPGHFGLQSPRERAAGVGGRLALANTLGLGTQLRVLIPMHGGSDG